MYFSTSSNKECTICLIYHLTFQNWQQLQTVLMWCQGVKAGVSNKNKSGGLQVLNNLCTYEFH